MAPRKATLVFILAFASGLWACGDDVMLVSSPTLETEEGRVTSEMGVGLQEEIYFQVQTCPFSLDHPDCETEGVDSLRTEVDPEFLQLEDISGPRVLIRAKAAGDSELDVRADGLSRSFTVRTKPVLSTKILLAVAYEAGDPEDQPVFLGSPPLAVRQLHFGNKEARGNALKGTTEMLLDPFASDARLLSLGQPRDGYEILVGERHGRPCVETVLGGKRCFPLVDEEAVVDLDVVRTYVQESLTLDVDPYERTFTLRPRNALGQAILGKGPVGPSISISGEGAAFVEVVPADTFPTVHTFALRGLAKGVAQVKITWGQAVVSLEVVVDGGTL